MAADGRLTWLIRLSLALGRLPHELAEQLTAADLALYQAYVEIDGPWWGEREAALLRQVCSMQAASVGADIPPDRFEIDWVVGERLPESAQLIPSADGLALFAGRHGLTLQEITE